MTIDTIDATNLQCGLIASIIWRRDQWIGDASLKDKPLSCRINQLQRIFRGYTATGSASGRDRPAKWSVWPAPASCADRCWGGPRRRTAASSPSAASCWPVRLCPAPSGRIWQRCTWPAECCDRRLWTRRCRPPRTRRSTARPPELRIYWIHQTSTSTSND